jgi:hypothetical protein
VDLLDFLRSLVASDAGAVAATAVTVGVVVWFIINRLDGVIADGMTKFIVSLALAFGVPIGAYIALQLLTASPITLNGLWLACTIGWIISQGIHRTAKTIAENKKRT